MNGIDSDTSAMTDYLEFIFVISKLELVIGTFYFIPPTLKISKTS
jgi:hypothetical protein